MLVSILGAAPKAPPDQRLLAIREISLLPVVDARAGDRANVDLDRFRNRVIAALNKKRYVAASAATSGRIDEEDLQAADPSFIRKLGPADSRWVMVVCLEDVASKITFGSTGTANVSGYLFDKESASLIWQGKGVGQAGQGGLMGMAMKGMMNGAAMESAVINLLKQLPDHPKAEKK